MKNSQNNFIITLDYDLLNTQIRKKEGEDNLLAWNGIYSCGKDEEGKPKFYSILDDEILLHRWRYLQGTDDSMELLGKVLDNIKWCLKLTYFDENGTGWEFDIDIDDSYCDHRYECDEETRDKWNQIRETVDRDGAAIFVEAESKIRYYKEYFLRLYDRAKTSINKSK